ncbi:MAG: flagellar biosynthesis repressor FlbT, partial [Asticcacaulis sp. 32-58-5]
ECVAISKSIMSREFYKALMGCRKLVDFEDALLGAKE